MKNKVFICTIFLVCVCLGGCSKYTSPDKSQMHIISLAPSITEILFELGLGDNIVGTTTFCDYPEEAKLIPKISDYTNPNIEEILKLQPTLVFTPGTEQIDINKALQGCGIKTKTINPESIEGVMKSILRISDITGTQGQAFKIVEDLSLRINTVRKKVRAIPAKKRPRVFIEIWHDPIITAGKGSFIDELITLAGGQNIAYDTRGPYVRFSPELVIKRNPDCIILGYMATGTESKEAIAKRLGWPEISAVKNGNIIDDINPDLFLRPGPRLIDGLEKIHKKLYK